MQLEDLGFCPKGEAADFVRDNTFTTDGSCRLTRRGDNSRVGQAGAAGGYLGHGRLSGSSPGRAWAPSPGARIGLISGFGMINYDRGVCSGAAIISRPGA